MANLGIDSGMQTGRKHGKKFKVKKGHSCTGGDMYLGRKVLLMKRKRYRGDLKDCEK